jgi:hypothetical protein
MFHTLAHPGKSCTPECSASCVKAGDPPSLTDARGNTYVLLTGEQGTPLMTPARLQMIGGQVNVRGLLVTRGSLQAIYVESMDKAEARHVTITGNLSCMFCTLLHPVKSCTPECSNACVKAGDPLLVTDAGGNMYVLLTGERGSPLITQARLDMMGGQVTVKGLLISRNGVQAIYVDDMQK